MLSQQGALKQASATTVHRVERDRSAGVKEQDRSAPVDRSARVQGQADWGGARESRDAPAQVLDRYTSVMAKTADSASSRNIFHFLFVAAHPYEISYAFSCSPTVTGKITVPVVEGELPLLLIYWRLRLRLRK